jgi:hypothetical protein
MKTTKIIGTIAAEKRSWEKELSFTFHKLDFGSKVWEESYMSAYTPISPYEIEIEVPDNVIDLIHTHTLKNLQIKRKLILLENQQRINDVETQISELNAIENKEN